MPSEAAAIDSVIEIVTPENIAFQYRSAGPFRRLPAFVLDMLFRNAIYWALFLAVVMLLGFAGSVSPALASFGAGLTFAFALVSWFFVSWFYGGVFEAYWNGQTPGKRLVGIRTLTTSGQPINGMQAVMRNIFREADMMPLLSVQMFERLTGNELPPMYVIPTFLCGLTAMVLTRRFQRFGDLVCGTMVVIEEKQWLTGVAKLDDARAPLLAAYIPADFIVSRSLARALAMYVDRRRFFSEPRRREVARHLGEPLVRLFGMPLDTSHDLLLCAMYYRKFISDRGDGEPRDMAGRSPFGAQSLIPGPAPFADVGGGAPAITPVGAAP